jgi:hypothetical protein
MALTLAFPYRPGPGECRPEATDLQKRIVAALDDKNIVTWRGDSGLWVVSYLLRDGYQVDIGYGGEGERPFMTPGMIETLKQMHARGFRDDEALKAAQAAESRTDAKKKALNAEQEEYRDYKRFRRRKSTHFSDHPHFRE